MEKLVDGGFEHEDFEEYAEHSLTHDDIPVIITCTASVGLPHMGGGI
jgi:hypothetical protein